MKIKKLNEDTLEQAVQRDVQRASNEIKNDVEVTATKKSSVEKALDRILRTAKRAQRTGSKEFQNLLLIGRAGVGKTAIVNRWAKENGVNLVPKDAKTMDPSDLGGIVFADMEHPGEATKLRSNELDRLQEPNSVLFLDEYNRAPADVRGSLLTLVNDHELISGKEKIEFPNLLFTVAAINPPSGGGNYNAEDLDPAERSRFYQEFVEAEPDVLLDYLVNKFFKPQLKNARDAEEEKEIEGRIKLATTLLSNKEFAFDDDIEERRISEQDPNAPILNPRSFTKALEMSDGTKDDFLDVWNHMCNRDKKGMVERILANYQDVDDKANDALKRYKNGEEVQSAFKKSGPNLWDKLDI